MKLKLKSDFSDYYDFWFDREGEVFIRNARNDVDRTQIFQILKKQFKLKVPMHGICRDMKEHFNKRDRVVVYTDPLAHCGEGKILIPFGEALYEHPDCLIAEYLKGEKRSQSIRYLSIGTKAFFLGYESDDEWRSNCGDVKVEIVGNLYYKMPYCDLPLFAIDFIKDYDTFYGVDFNSAPGLNGTGIEDLLKPAEVVQLIKDRINFNRPSLPSVS